MDVTAHGCTIRGDVLVMHLVVLKADVRESGMGVYTNLSRSSFSKKKGEDGEIGFQSVLYRGERETVCFSRQGWVGLTSL